MGILKEKPQTPNEFIRSITHISDETNVTYDMVLDIIKKTNQIITINGSTNGKELTLKLISLWYRKSKSLQSMLKTNGIHSSSDIGIVIFKLTEYGLLGKEEDDHQTDFNGLFKTGEIDVYLKENKIKRSIDLLSVFEIGFLIIGFLFMVLSSKQLLSHEFKIIGLTLLAIVLLYRFFKSEWLRKLFRSK